MKAVITIESASVNCLILYKTLNKSNLTMVERIMLFKVRIITSQMEYSTLIVFHAVSELILSRNYRWRRVYSLYSEHWALLRWNDRTVKRRAKHDIVQWVAFSIEVCVAIHCCIFNFKLSCSNLIDIHRHALACLISILYCAVNDI